MCLSAPPTEESCTGEMGIQTPEQLGLESLYESPEGQKDWPGWGCEWRWCCRLWVELGRGTLELRICGLC